MTEAQAILRQGQATLGEGEPAAPALRELEIAWTPHRRGQVQEAQPTLERVATSSRMPGTSPGPPGPDRLAMNLSALGRATEALRPSTGPRRPTVERPTTNAAS